MDMPGCTINLCSTTEQAKTGTVPRRIRTSRSLAPAIGSQRAAFATYSTCWDSPLRHGCHQYSFLGGIRLGTVPEAI